jgi:hypothetical protein
LSKRPQKGSKKGLSPAEGMFGRQGSADTSLLPGTEAAAASLPGSLPRSATGDSISPLFAEIAKGVGKT